MVFKKKCCSVVVPPLQYRFSPSGSLAYFLFPIVLSKLFPPLKQWDSSTKMSLHFFLFPPPLSFSFSAVSRLPKLQRYRWWICVFDLCPVILRYRKYHWCRMWLKKESKIDKKKEKGEKGHMLSKQTVKLYKEHFQSSTHFMFFYYHLLRFFLNVSLKQ